MPVWKVRASAYPFLVFGADGVDDLVDILRCPERAEVVILVGIGDAEEGDDSIADILLDEAVITVNDLGHLAEDTARDLFDFFRVELLGHGGVAREVGEEDGDVFALRGGRGCSQGSIVERVAACVTELRCGRELIAALGTSNFKPLTALETELRIRTIVNAALRAFHLRPPRCNTRTADKLRIPLTRAYGSNI